MEGRSANCIFCLEKLKPPFEEIPLVFSDDGEDSAIHGHLKTFFILKWILKINDEVLCELLGLNEGKSQPENWINVCCECGKLVRMFYEDLQLHSTLERKPLGLEALLMKKIFQSKEKQAEGERDPVWERIRSEAMKVYVEDNPVVVKSHEDNHQMVEDIAFSSDSLGDYYANSDVEYSQIKEETNEMEETDQDVVLSPFSSFVPDSPSKPFEFWDSSEEDTDNDEQIKMNEPNHSSRTSATSTENVNLQDCVTDILQEIKVGDENESDIENLSLGEILDYQRSFDELETQILAQNGMEINLSGENLDPLRLPDPCSREENVENDDSDSSATISAPNTPMCLSSDDEEDSQQEIHALKGKRKQIFIRKSTCSNSPKIRWKVRHASRCPEPGCGLLILGDSLWKHLRTHRIKELAQEEALVIKKATRLQNKGYKTFKGNGNRTGYKCSSCPAFFATLRAIKNHLQLHVPDSKVIICGENQCGWFVAPKQMHQHRKNNHPDLKYKCDTCPTICTSPAEFTGHQKLHELGKGEVCSVCECLVRNLRFHKKKGCQNVILTSLESESRETFGIKLVSDEVNESSEREDSSHLEPEVKLAPPSKEEDDDTISVVSVNQRSLDQMPNLDNTNPLYISFTVDGRKVYKCRQCEAKMGKVTLLKSHLKVHDDQELKVGGIRRSLRNAKKNCN